jgi:short-subunit dehydrogenase
MNNGSNRLFAVVTGTSSGIGYELARQFVEQRYDLLIVAEDAGRESAAATLQARGAGFDGVDRL